MKIKSKIYDYELKCYRDLKFSIGEKVFFKDEKGKFVYDNIKGIIIREVQSLQRFNEVKYFIGFREEPFNEKEIYNKNEIKNIIKLEYKNNLLIIKNKE